jgi:hypothetical protein
MQRLLQRLGNMSCGRPFLLHVAAINAVILQLAGGTIKPYFYYVPINWKPNI